MKKKVFLTSDGSPSLRVEEIKETYHSRHGALTESTYVYIDKGLDYWINNNHKNELNIFEMGFGTGLNCFITYLEGKRVIDYVGVEAYPVTAEEVEKMNFISVLKAEKDSPVFEKMHAVSWEEKHQISETFFLLKRKQLFENIEDEDAFNLIYFDAFGARVQPELWSEEIFRKMFNALKENGILVTYSAKGSVRRAMQAVGFTVERLPGPLGKREMLRAIKK